MKELVQHETMGDVNTAGANIDGGGAADPVGLAAATSKSARLSKNCRISLTKGSGANL
jgi:hypothetical protein